MSSSLPCLAIIADADFNADSDLKLVWMVGVGLGWVGWGWRLMVFPTKLPIYNSLRLPHALSSCANSLSIHSTQFYKQAQCVFLSRPLLPFLHSSLSLLLVDKSTSDTTAKVFSLIFKLFWRCLEYSESDHWIGQAKPVSSKTKSQRREGQLSWTNSSLS